MMNGKGGEAVGGQRLEGGQPEAGGELVSKAGVTESQTAVSLASAWETPGLVAAHLVRASGGRSRTARNLGRAWAGGTPRPSA